MTDSPPPAGERLAKVIARAGLCSRRDAETWIREGRVAVNGNIIRTPAFNVSEKDRISVDGQPLQLRSGTRLWLYHKPPGLVVTEKDPEGRPTIFEALEPEGLPRVLTVGRLDINTEGLLLLTNDGGLKRVLELPSTGWLRRYRVRAFGSITQAELDKLKHGIEIDGIKYGPIEARLERQQGSNVWLLFALREGKNREVKNVLATLGLTVNRLIRVSYGPFQLGDLPVGAVEPVRARVLRDQLGNKLAAEAGVDFESDMPEVAAVRRERARPGAERDRPPAPRGLGRPRRIHFDDGRPPEEFTPPPERKPRGERPARAEGRAPAPARKSFAAHERPQTGAGPRRGPRPADRSAGTGNRPRAGGPRGAGSRAEGSHPGGPRPASRPAGTDNRPRPGSSRPGGPRAGAGPEGSHPGGPRPASRPAGTDNRPRPGSARPGGSRPGDSRPGRSRPGGSRPGGSRPGGPRPGGPRPPRKPRP